MTGYRDESDEIVTKLLRCRIDIFKEILEGYAGGINLGETNNIVEYKNYLINNPIEINAIGGDGMMFDPSLCVATATGINVFGSTIHTSIRNGPIKYLVIHYTAGGNSKPGRALETCNGWTKPDRKASADFVVDDATMYQYTPDPTKYYCWAVGNPLPGRPYNNSNCVSIEICSSWDPTRGKDSRKANDPGFYFTRAVLGNAIKLAKIIMSTYKIPINNVIRHYDVSGKHCPGIIGWNPDTPGDEREWHNFKAMLV